MNRTRSHNRTLVLAMISMLSGLILLPSLSAAAQAPLDLAWSAPAGCPGESVLRSRVSALIGADQDVEVAASIAITTIANGFELRLSTPTGAERVVQGSRCNDLIDAAALVLALMIAPDVMDVPDAQVEPRFEDNTIEIPRAPTTEVGEALASPVLDSMLIAPVARLFSPAIPEIEQSRIRPPVVFGFNAAPVLSIGALPSTTGGIEAELTLSRRHLFATLGMLYLPRSEGTIEGQPAVGGHLRLTTVVARVCGSFGGDTWRVAPCATTQIGAFAGRGFGISNPESGRTGWFSLGGGLHGEYSIGARAHVFIRGEFEMPIRRTRFGFIGIGEIHQPSAVTGRFALGVGMRFR